MVPLTGAVNFLDGVYLAGEREEDGEDKPEDTSGTAADPEAGSNEGDTDTDTDTAGTGAAAGAGAVAGAGAAAGASVWACGTSTVLLSSGFM